MNISDGQACDVVTIATVANDPDLMSLAIEFGYDCGLVTSPYDGTALIAAAHLGHVDIVRRLIATGALLENAENQGFAKMAERLRAQR
jgi:hypothetical protein